MNNIQKRFLSKLLAIFFMLVLIVVGAMYYFGAFNPFSSLGVFKKTHAINVQRAHNDLSKLPLNRVQTTELTANCYTDRIKTKLEQCIARAGYRFAGTGNLKQDMEMMNTAMKDLGWRVEGESDSFFFEYFDTTWIETPISKEAIFDGITYEKRIGGTDIFAFLAATPPLDSIIPEEDKWRGVTIDTLRRYVSDGTYTIGASVRYEKNYSLK